jgi:predicted RNA binding protein YcfA (HicA-like mRNA interferase family)
MLSLDLRRKYFIDPLTVTISAIINQIIKDCPDRSSSIGSVDQVRTFAGGLFYFSYLLIGLVDLHRNLFQQYLPKRGKGSHERWRHPALAITLTIPGKDGDDVPLYLEKQLARLLAELEDLNKEDEDS